ncbi:MAG TPA: TetR/AcrR family transcriptional regulator [Candidatus Cloacimonadota bacterium]|nr:TetR/AcrR family transcriptional regulator [Candidatus Cloacimonadota bacterium]
MSNSGSIRKAKNEMNEISDKKELILNTAESIFEKYGYAKTSMDDIANEAYIGKGTIYYYFKSKEDIFLELVVHYHKMIRNLVEKEMSKCTSFDQKFKLMIELPIKYAIEKYPIYFEALKTPSKSLLKKISNFKNENRAMLYEKLVSLIREAQANQEVDENVDVEKLIEVLIRWFFLGDDDINVTLSKEGFEKFIKEYDLFIYIILYGIKKRS